MSGFPLDRKAMEEERLARVAARQKRERSISPPPPRSPRKAPKLQETTTVLASGAKLNCIFTAPTPATASQPDTQIKSERDATLPPDVKIKPEPDTTTTMPNPVLKYPHGTIKRTWAFRCDRDNDIKIEEVLEAASLTTAVISAFKWDMDWVFSKLKTPEKGGKTKCVFVMEGKDERLRRTMLEETENARSWLEFCFPPMDSAWCMHSKLMLLFHPNKLRIAIPTANLLEFDWGETGMMENSVFLIDLPRLPDNIKSSTDELTPFGKELLFFMQKQTISQKVLDGVLRFDFSATAHLAFVHSIGGSLYGDEAQRTGLAGLSTAVRSLNLCTSDALNIDFAASSIGSLKTSYLKELHSAARGIDPFAAATQVATKSKVDFFKKASTKTSPAGSRTSVLDQMRIYFPTKATVTASRARAAGTICLQRKWFEAATFPRSIFRDYVSTRTDLLSHNKMLCARGVSAPDGDQPQKKIAWVYVGSANMSMSAWGTPTAASRKEPRDKITCRNWECGVLMPVPAEVLAAEEDVIEVTKEANDEPLDDDVQIVKVQTITKGKHEDSETESDVDSQRTESDVEDDVPVSSARSILPASSQVSAPPSSAAQQVARKVDAPSMDVFRHILTLPFKVPAEGYNGREPWYFTEE